jgi:predicted amidophosphoribosyltransferase
MLLSQWAGFAKPSHPVRWRRLRAGWRRALAADCLACGLQRGAPFCRACEADFVPPSLARCPRCAARLPALRTAAGSVPPPCGACLAAAPCFDATIALGDYRAPLDAMVLALKSAGRLDIGRALGELLARRARSRLAPDCLVLPVPLAR